MLINPKKLLRRERQLKAVIGMGGKEFKILHKQFDEIYNKIQQKKLIKRAIGGGRQGVIKDTKSKLLFILMYVKFYPTYDLAGALFGVVASRPHEWVNEYLPILEEALGRHCVLPARKITSAEEFKRLYPGVQEVILDGAERPIQRPKNNKNQKKAYSGKKKRHTRKNIYLVNKEKKILYLSPTKAGKIHDFKQFKKTAVILITLNKLINISPFSITSFSNLSLCLNKIIPSFYTSVNYFITSFKNSILQKSTFYCLPSVFTTV